MGGVSILAIKVLAHRDYCTFTDLTAVVQTERGMCFWMLDSLLVLMCPPVRSVGRPV